MREVLRVVQLARRNYTEFRVTPNFASLQALRDSKLYVTLGVTPQSPLVATENPRLAAARSRAPIDSTLIPCSPFDTHGFGDTLRLSPPLTAHVKPRTSHVAHISRLAVSRVASPLVSP